MRPQKRRVPPRRALRERTEACKRKVGENQRFKSPREARENAEGAQAEPRRSPRSGQKTAEGAHEGPAGAPKNAACPRGEHARACKRKVGGNPRQEDPRRVPREPKGSPGERQDDSGAAGGSRGTAQNSAPEAQECQVEAPKNAACPRGSLNESTARLAEAMLAKPVPREQKKCFADAQRMQKNTACPRDGPQRKSAEISATQRKSSAHQEDASIYPGMHVIRSA